MAENTAAADKPGGYGPAGSVTIGTKGIDIDTSAKPQDSSKTNAGLGTGASYDPRTGQASGKGNVRASIPLGIFKFSAEGSGDRQLIDQETRNGITTYKVAWSLQSSATIGAAAKPIGSSIEQGFGTGRTGSYQVTLPAVAAKGVDLRALNPENPDALPKGCVIRMDASSYTTSDSKLVLRNLAMQTKVKDEQGTSVVVEKLDGNKVRVLVGPTSVLSVYNAAGADFERVKLMLGRNDKLGDSKLTSVEFDLGTAQGREAYQAMLGKGQLPKKDGVGIANLQTVQTLDYSSQSSLKAEFKIYKDFGLKFDVDGAKNTGKSVITTYPDGSSTQVVDIQYSGNVPLTISRKFDANGKELTDQCTYRFTFKAGAGAARDINVALSGDPGKAEGGPVHAGDTVTLTWTQAQMSRLRGMAMQAASLGQSNDLKLLTQGYGGAPVSTQDFALGLARNGYGGVDMLTGRLLAISNGADGVRGNGYTPLPGQLGVRDAQDKPRQLSGTVVSPAQSASAVQSPRESASDPLRAGIRDRLNQLAGGHEWSDQSRESLTYGLMAQALREGILKPDHVFLNKDQTRLFVLEGDPKDINRRMASIDIAQTLQRAPADLANEATQSRQAQVAGAVPAQQEQAPPQSAPRLS